MLIGLLKKGLVLGIILLFVGASVTQGLSIKDKPKNIRDNEISSINNLAEEKGFGKGINLSSGVTFAGGALSKRQMHNIVFDSNSECKTPNWKLGNKWTYKVDKIVVNFEKPDLSVYLNGKIDNLELEVITVSEDSYELKIKADIGGSCEFITDLGHGPINITGKLQSTTIDGNITFNKTDLGIKQVYVELSGRVTVKAFEQPYFDLSFLPNIPIPADILFDMELGDPYSTIEFPLNTSKCWGIPATNFSLRGNIQSLWLRVANFINKLIRIPGVITILAAIFRVDRALLQNISDILIEIFPKIDIKDFLNDYLGGNVFDILEAISDSIEGVADYIMVLLTSAERI